MSHLLPDMIDKSPPSAISAKLLFRRAAARFTPSSPPPITFSFFEQNGPNTSVSLSFFSSRFLLSPSLSPSPPAQHLYGTRNRSRKCIRNKLNPAPANCSLRPRPLPSPHARLGFLRREDSR